MTTGNASNINQSGATLAGSYSGASSQPYSLGFEYGTSQYSLTETAYWNDVIPEEAGNYSVTLNGLASGTTYYYRAIVQVGSQDFYGDVKSFTTSAAPQPSSGWLEMPAASSGANLFSESLKVNGTRNYSYLYDKSLYTALWVAYPLCNAHTSGSGHTSSWRWNPNIAQQYQINVKDNAYGTNYNAGSYARGHQIPNADRKSDDTMNEQTYYLTNQTPQLQQKFNGSIWSSLENSIRTVASNSPSDTIYVVTGAAFRKKGGSETINYLHSGTVTPSDVPIPNYYWKVLLRVKRSAGSITSACAVGVWLDHKEYSDSNWSGSVVSVDQIEAWTGFDFFVNLPDAFETAAEANTSWSAFSDF